MIRIANLIRMKEWMFSKIPFMFVPILLCILKNGEGIFGKAVYFTYFIYLFSFFSFGYAINDYSDRENDRIIGKQNIMGELPQPLCILILVICVIGSLPFVIMCENSISIIFMIIVYFWGAAYSVKPFRFKEKGIWGLIVCALAQRSLPLLPLLAITPSIAGMVAVWSVVGGLVGLRYILIHQVIDLENDKKTKTETFALHHFNLTIKSLYLCLALEIAVLIGFIVMYHPFQHAIGLCLSYGVIVLVTFYTVHYIYAEAYFSSYVAVPLEDFYNFYYPLYLIILLLPNNLMAYVLLICLALIGIGPMINKWKIVLFGIEHLGKR